MSEIAHATMTAAFTAADDGDGDTGRILALVSAYGVKYRIGFDTWHTIMPGAFADSIAAQPSIPLFYAHNWTDGAMPIGHATAAEGDDGLEIDGRLYLDADPALGRLWQALKAGAIREYSIGYAVRTQTVDDDDETHYHVGEAELLEASAVLRGANPATRTLELAHQVLGRPPTDTERQLIAAGRPLPSSSGVTAEPAPPVPAPARVPVLCLYGSAP